MAAALLTSNAAGLELAHPLRELEAQGYARLGRILTGEATVKLRAAAEDLLLGRCRYPEMFFQLDAPTGRYGDVVFDTGYVGPRLDYRKVEKLELEPRFRALIENPLFARIAHARIGPEVSIYRAVLWVKSAGGGTELPWHQDGGRFWGLDRDPTTQVWVALDDAPVEAGCVEVLPGSHRRGLETPFGGQLSAAALDREQANARALPLPCEAGEALLLHNFTWHRSGLNRSGVIRRAVGICFMDAATRCTRKKRAPRQFVRVFEAAARPG